MPGKFADSNIMLYLASADVRKSQVSDGLLRGEATCIVSVQVLNEITNVLRRKYRFSWDETRIFLDMIRSACEVVNFSFEDHMLGLDLAERYGFSIYDSMIVASALQVRLRHPLFRRHAAPPVDRRGANYRQPISLAGRLVQKIAATYPMRVAADDCIFMRLC